MFQRTTPQPSIHTAMKHFHAADVEVIESWRCSHTWGLEETFRYFNGLGEPILLFRADGAHWYIEPDSTYTGEFRIEYRALSKSNRVDFKEAPSIKGVEDDVKERARKLALTKSASKVGQNWQWFWTSKVHSQQFHSGEVVYLPELDMCLSHNTNLAQVPAHPSTVESRVGDDLLRTDGCGVFIVNISGEVPPLYANIDGRVNEIPNLKVYNVDEGVYRYFTSGGVTEFQYVEPENYSKVNDKWEIPIYRTAEEAARNDAETQLAIQAAAHEREVEDIRREQEIALAKLESKITKMENDTSIAKKDAETRQLVTKEEYAERGHHRNESMEVLKTVATLGTVAFGLYKLLA